MNSLSSTELRSYRYVDANLEPINEINSPVPNGVLSFLFRMFINLEMNMSLNNPDHTEIDTLDYRFSQTCTSRFRLSTENFNVNDQVDEQSWVYESKILSDSDLKPISEEECQLECLLRVNRELLNYLSVYRLAVFEIRLTDKDPEIEALKNSKLITVTYKISSSDLLEKIKAQIPEYELNKLKHDLPEYK